MSEHAVAAAVDARVLPLRIQLDLDTRLFLNCLDGVSEAQGAQRPSDDTNSLAFVAAHVTDSRFFLARVLGATVENPLEAQLAGARSIADLASCPSLAESRAAWQAVSGPLMERLDALDAAALDRPAAQRFPVDDRTVLGTLAFLAQHEAYHIGQLALLRKFAGLPAMTYARRPSAP